MTIPVTACRNWRVTVAKYTLYWKTGDREVVEGATPAQAMTLVGYGGGAVGALDFYASGDNDQYQWNRQTCEWDRKPELEGK